MFKKALKKKTDSALSAVGGIAVLIGSYVLMAAVNAILAQKDR